MTLPEKHPDVAYVSDTLWEAALTMACNRQCYIFERFRSTTNWESEIAIGIIDHARCLILLGEVKGPVDPLDAAIKALWCSDTVPVIPLRNFAATCREHFAGLTFPEVKP
jgi:hypothetical protein